jgi:LacI family transcriptional regulator
MAQLRYQRPVESHAGIAYLNAHETRSAWQNFETNRIMFEAARDRATQLGFNLQEFWMNDPEISPDRMKTILDARGIRGVLVANLPDTTHFSTPFAFDNYCSASLGCRVTQPPLHCVENDHFNSMRLAFAECWKLGYRRPGLFLRRSINSKLENRFFSAFLGLQSEHQTHSRVPILADSYGKDQRDESVARLRAWFGKHRPDVIMTMSNYVISALESDGFGCPDDFGYVHLDLNSNDETSSGINQNNAHVGIAGVDMVVAQLHRNEVGIPAFTKVLMIESSWKARGTTRAQREGESLRCRPNLAQAKRSPLKPAQTSRPPTR